jgi:NADH pyrophosphatase NudC (nudix superfamily)
MSAHIVPRQPARWLEAVMKDDRNCEVRFCTRCGSPLEERWLELDQRYRPVCVKCGNIHYKNPHVLVAAMITCGTRLLMCRRAQEPAVGLWTTPAGFMEEHETLEQATVRELYEETGVRVDPDCLILHTIANLPFISEVYVTFRGTVNATEVRCGPECLDVKFFEPGEIPWNSLAYSAMSGYLKLFLREMASNRFGVHVGHMDPQGKSRRTYELRAIGEKQYSGAKSLPRRK